MHLGSHVDDKAPTEKDRQATGAAAIKAPD